MARIGSGSVGLIGGDSLRRASSSGVTWDADHTYVMEVMGEGRVRLRPGYEFSAVFKPLSSLPESCFKTAYSVPNGCVGKVGVFHKLLPRPRAFLFSCFAFQRSIVLHMRGVPCGLEALSVVYFPGEFFLNPWL